MSAENKQRLIRGIKILVILGLLVIAVVLIDFAFDRFKPDKEYRFMIPQLEWNKPVVLTQDNMMIVLARYDEQTIDGLTHKGRLGKISESFRQQQSRVDEEGYFVVMGYGSDKGCALEIHPGFFKESCSDASYDLLGRSQQKQLYPDLDIPEYTFNQDYSILRIE